MLIILAGIVISFALGENGLLGKAKEAKENYIQAAKQEEKDLEELYSSIKVASGSQVTLTMEELNTYIEKKLESSYQKLRSDKFEEVPVIHKGKFIAPCDGYYCMAAHTQDANGTYIMFASHYTKDDVFISYVPSTGSYYSRTGCELYMRKGEYIITYKESSTIISSSKFFYAVGCTSDTE